MDAIARLPFGGNFEDFSELMPSIPEPQERQRRHYRTIWIRDVHLGTRG